jgi:hypothetical protein
MAQVRRTGIAANDSDLDPVRFLGYCTCDHYAPLSEEVP